MILILEMVQTDFGQRLRSVLEKQGEKTLLLTSMQIAQEVSISFNINSRALGFVLRYQDLSLHSDDLQGVYCGITSFAPALFPNFSVEDAQYAALETQALWLAMLSSLACSLVNPPALDTLTGTMLSPVELADQAQTVGFHTPAVVCVENGKAAAQIYQSCTPARFSDLGKTWINETTHSQIEINQLSQSQNQFLIQEIPPGQTVGVGMIGRQLFPFEHTSEDGFQPMKLAKVPDTIRSKIRKLQKRLYLNAAEYLFKHRNDEWTLCGVTHPPQFTLQAYQDEAFSVLATFLSG